MEHISTNLTSSTPTLPVQGSQTLAGLTLNLKNIIFILTASVSFALWLSSTISTPKRLEVLESSLNNLSIKQGKIETKTDLIYQDLQTIKNNFLQQRSNKND